jgi:hypothetical protein
MKYYNVFTFIFVIIFSLSCNETSTQKIKSTVPEAAQFKPAGEYHSHKLSGQSIYVPIYSSIYNQFEGNLLHMTAILSIRNISPKSEIIIKKIEYYDTNGKLIKKYIDKPFSLGKMSTKDFVIAENDLEGGTGANFIVEWDAKQKVSIPIVEAVMIGNLGTKGFSFSSRGKEVEAH